MNYSRREILRAMALGGALIAGELWIPGRRVISIPEPRFDYEGLLRLTIDRNMDELVGYNYSYIWIAEYADIKWSKLNDRDVWAEPVAPTP